MADLYDILAVIPVTEFLPPNRTREVKEITARAKPSDVVFYFRVTPADYAASHIQLAAHDLAIIYNRMAATPGVETVTNEQDVTADSQVAQHVVIGVTSDSGASEDFLRLTYQQAVGPTFAAKVAAAVAELNAIEAL